MATRIPARLTAAEGRKFGLTVGGAFLVLAAIAWWRAHPITLMAFGTLGALLVLAGAAVPTRLGPIQRGWMGFAHRLSRITTPVMLGVIYYVVLTPTGLIMRLFGHRPLSRAPKADTFWIARPVAAQRADLQRQF